MKFGHDVTLFSPSITCTLCYLPLHAQGHAHLEFGLRADHDAVITKCTRTSRTVTV